MPESRYENVLRRLKLENVEQVREAEGRLLKRMLDRRDLRVFDTTDDAGRPLRLYLKRSLRAVRKDAWRSLLRHGRVWSGAREEFENLLALRAAGIETCEPVSYGEECSALAERFSYVIVAAVPAEETLLDFLARCGDARERGRVIEALARVVRQMHNRGLAWPDLYGRHVFVRPDTEPPRLIMLDVARLDRGRIGVGRRARDLANLSMSVPEAYATRSERLAFLATYEGERPRRLLRWAIALRLWRLARTKKGRKLAASKPHAVA